MVSEQSKNEVGEILFGMLSTAMNERGMKMEFSSWGKVDGQVKENYMRVVDSIIEKLEPSPLYISKKDREKVGVV